MFSIPRKPPVHNLDGTITIDLAHDHSTIVDECDFDLTEFKWVYCPSRKGGYAVRSLSRKLSRPRQSVKLHRVILERIVGRSLNNNEFCDHIDGDYLNNRRSNLRIATNAENTRNGSKRINNTSGYKGVSLNKATGKWLAYISVNYHRIYLGYFNTPEEAAAVYTEAARRFHGEFARFE